MDLYHCHEVRGEEATLPDLRSLGVEAEHVHTVGQGGEWTSLLDLLVHICRSNGKLRRKLVSPLPDLDVLCRMLLQESNKELTGDSLFTRSELYELKSTLLRVRQSGTYFAETEDSTVNLAARQYKEFLEKCNLVDVWSVCSEYRKLNQTKLTVLLLSRPTQTDSNILNFFNVATSKLITQKDDKYELGDSFSIEEMEKGFSLDDDTEEDSEFGLKCPGVESWIAFTRLLVNSRDELSLARLVTQTGLLTHAQCQVVRKETKKTKLTMLQNLVSFSTQTSLGGKSYAPGEEHPFLMFQPAIVDLVKLVENAQTKIESVKEPEVALERVTTGFKNWLQKRGVKTSCDLVQVCDKVCKKLKSRHADTCGTPGRGLLGKPVVNMLTGLVDLYAAMSREETSEECEAKTPARSKKLTRFFRTPGTVTRSSDAGSSEQQDEFDIHVNKAGVGEKLKDQEKDKSESPDVGTPVRPQYTRYKSSLAWAEDSSPVPESAESCGVRVFGSTLVSAAASSPATPLSSSAASTNDVKSILQEIKDRQEEERKQESEALLKEKILPAEKKKSRKRLLVKEAELDMMEKYGVEIKKSKKTEENSEKDEDKPKKEPAKKPAGGKKKKIATPKGQKKLTAFFRV